MLLEKSSCCLPVRGFFNSVTAESYRASKGESAVSKENRQVQPARTAKQHACIVQVSRDAAEKFPHAILVRASCRKTILLLANTCMIDLQWRSCCLARRISSKAIACGALSLEPCSCSNNDFVPEACGKQLDGLLSEQKDVIAMAWAKVLVDAKLVGRRRRPAVRLSCRSSSLVETRTFLLACTANLGAIIFLSISWLCMK